jgi:two-component system chemotaxis response regulator CheY
VNAALKVLVVEDSRATREVIAAALEALGPVEVHVAATGFEALKVLPRHHFALIITDLHMPDINGLELINFVKKNPHYRDTPLVVLTSDHSEQTRARSLQLGANEYLLKPFEAEVIAALGRRLLAL